MFKRNSRGGSFNRGRKPQFNRGGSFSRGRGGRTERLDVSRFINKASATEEVSNFVPKHSFADFQVAEALKANIISKGYVNPTPIQDQAIPAALSGRDVVGIANTGTGKTAAFLIPLINKVLNNKNEKVIVIVPTRELAIQINQEFMQFTRGLGIYSACCVGGMPIGRQIGDLKRQHHFVIGTPGRLKDLHNRRCLPFNNFNTVVLDEADRMLDMGFIDDMRLVMSKMPANRQTLFFSATLSREIERLITEFLRDPINISVKTRDTSKNIDQDVVRVPRGANKEEMLHELLSQTEFQKVLVFGQTKHGVERLSGALLKRGIKSESIHGNKNHGQRQRALQSFKANSVQVLVATDVAARGLDIPDVSHVINFDLPATYDDYVHRIGRTGRGDKKGKALTFID
jgi:ATP-dependent RNA helicase RhlE